MNIRKILIVLTLILFVGLIGALCYNKYEENKQSEYMSQLAEEASQYEKQKKELNEQITQKENEITQREVRPMIVAAFYVESRAEARMAISWAKEYMPGKSITFLLNPMTDSIVNDEIIETIIYRADQPYQIAVYGNVQDENVRNNTNILLGQLQERQLEKSRYWFLSEGSNINDQAQWLWENNFTAYSQMTSYANVIDSGKNQDFYYMEYVPVKQGENNIERTISLCMEENTVAAILFPVNELNSLIDNEREGLVQSVFSVINANGDRITVQTPGEVYDFLENQAMNEGIKRAEYEVFKAEKELEIAELDKTIGEIYGKNHGGTTE